MTHELIVVAGPEPALEVMAFGRKASFSPGSTVSEVMGFLALGNAPCVDPEERDTFDWDAALNPQPAVNVIAIASDEYHDPSPEQDASEDAITVREYKDGIYRARQAGAR